MRLRATLGVVVVGLLALVASACAIPTQGSPSSLPASKVPFHLLDPHPPTTPTSQPNVSSYVPVTVYFLNASNQPVTAQRYVPSPGSLSAIVGSLLKGPSTGEAAQHITTAIPANVHALSVSQPQNHIVTVNMNTAFGEISGSNTELAVAQIVFTVAAEAGASTGVVFEIDGQRTSVPIANGSQVNGPVYALEFL